MQCKKKYVGENSVSSYCISFPFGFYCTLYVLLLFEAESHYEAFSRLTLCCKTGLQVIEIYLLLLERRSTPYTNVILLHIKVQLWELIQARAQW